MYVGKADNPSFGTNEHDRFGWWSAYSCCAVGSEPLDILSRRIFESYGPSGANKVLSTPRPVTEWANGLAQDYLYHLVKAVKELSPVSHDSHLEALEVPLSP